MFSTFFSCIGKNYYFVRKSILKTQPADSLVIKEISPKSIIINGNSIGQEDKSTEEASERYLI